MCGLCRLNPFWFRAGGVHKYNEDGAGIMGLNPFWFRAGGVFEKRASGAITDAS